MCVYVCVYMCVYIYMFLKQRPALSLCLGVSNSPSTDYKT